MINFDDILRMRQKELKHYLSGHLKKEGYEVISKKGFLYRSENAFHYCSFFIGGGYD